MVHLCVCGVCWRSCFALHVPKGNINRTSAIRFLYHYPFIYGELISMPANTFLICIRPSAVFVFVIASCSPSPLSSLFIRKYAQIYRINSILASRSVEYRSFSITPIIRRLGCNIHIRLESIFRTIGHHANASLGAQVEWLSNGEFSELRRRSHEIKRQYTLLLCYNMFQPIDFHARPCVLGARMTWSAI